MMNFAQELKNIRMQVVKYKFETKKAELKIWFDDNIKPLMVEEAIEGKGAIKFDFRYEEDYDMLVNNYDIFKKIGIEYGLKVEKYEDDILFVWN